MFETKTCVGCGTLFSANRSDQMYHSKECRLRDYKRTRDALAKLKKSKKETSK